MVVVGETSGRTEGFAAVMRRTAGNLSAWTRGLVSRQRLRAGRLRSRWMQPLMLVALAIVACSAILAAMLFFDATAIGWQRALPTAVVQGFAHITDIGKSAWILVPTGLAVLLLAAVASPRLGRLRQLVLVSVATRLGFLFVAVGLPGLLVTVVKRMLGRQRPNIWVTTDPTGFSPFTFSPEYTSLPSGHGATAFATAIALGALYPRWRVPLLALACVVGFSRVAVSVHYPSDVLAGACIGTLGALAVRNWFAARRLAFVVTGEGGVHPMPGPSLRRLRGALRSLRA